MKTWNAKKEDVEAKWYLVDATDKSLGRLSTQIATILRGKHRPTFTPHVDTGDFVVVINADKISMTGKKWLQKMFYTRSRYFGSVKEATAQQMMDKNPTFLLEEAVQGMLPKTKLGKQIATKL